MLFQSLIPLIKLLINYYFLFLRTTKKAYLSFLSPVMLALVRGLDYVPSYNAIRLACRRKDINMDMRLCRKLFASWLHESGLPDITIDILQGRCPRSILAQHYVVPNESLRTRVLDAISQLANAIDK
jgi:intergrase/recombinase